jgi:hypothetical protein
LACLILEFCLNRTKLRYRYVFFVIIFSIAFLFLNFLGTCLFNKKPIYPWLLDWFGTGPYFYLDRFKQFYFFLITFLLTNIFASLFVTFVHKLKEKYCCKKRQKITESLPETSQELQSVLVGETIDI